jgi:hypothetical protein
MLGARLANETISLRVETWGTLNPALLIGEHALMTWRAVGSGRETFPAKCTRCYNVNVVDSLFSVCIIVLLISIE